MPSTRSAVPELVTTGQLRWFSFVPQRHMEISKVVLESYDNNVARMTGNVLKRFIDPIPFPLATTGD